MDYRYLLFFERGARFDVLERLAELSNPDPDHETALVLPDRTVTLPFSSWLQTGSRIAWNDASPTWDFMTVLCFEPDEPIESYLARLNQRYGRDDGVDDLLDAKGRAPVGIIYLTVHNDMSDWTSGRDEDLVLFEFGTPGSTMSVLFTESDSIRRTFVELLRNNRGVYGLLDREDPADLFWWLGEEVDQELPTAELALDEIGRLLGDPD